MRIFSFLREPAPRFLLCGTLCGLPFWAAPLPLSGQFPGEFVGRVVDAVSGAGIFGARVFLSDGAIRGATNPEGQIHLRGLEPGIVQLSVEALGYRRAEFSIRILNGSVTHLQMPLHPEALTLEGLEARTSHPGGRAFDEAAIRDSGARTLGDFLSAVPGVVVRRRGPGGPEEISLRGGESDQVLILIDGVPFADPLGGGADLSSVSLSGVGRIEILPGAQTARFGSGALSGVVLISTARTLTSPFEGRIEAGSLGEKGVAFHGGKAFSRSGIPSALLSAGISGGTAEGSFPFRHDAFLGGGEARRTNADWADQSVFATLATAKPGPHSGHLRVSMDRGERGIPGKSFAPSDSARQDRSRVSLAGGWEWEMEGQVLLLSVHHLRQEVHLADPAPPLGPPFDTRTALVASGIEGEFGRGVSRAGFGRWAIGASLRSWQIDSDQLSGPGQVDRIDGSVHFRLDGTGLDLPAGATPAFAVRAHRDGATGDWLAAHDLSLGLALGPLSLHTAHRSGFSPPSPGDLFFREGVGIAPNPELRAERIPSEFEAGFSLLRAGENLELQLSGEAFIGAVRDMIVWMPDFRFVWRPGNVDVHRRGATLRGDLALRPWGVRMGGHWTHTRATYDRGDAGGSQVAYRPRHTAGASLGWAGRGLRTELRARYTGLRYPVPAPINALDPFWNVEGTVGFTGTLGGWEFSPLLRVDRLLDDRSPFIHAFPEPGRTLRFELRVRRGSG